MLPGTSTKGEPRRFWLAMSFGICFEEKSKISEVHESLAVCLTIRQNELRLGRQQISSLKKVVFKTRLLTSSTDPLTEVGRPTLREGAKK